MKKNQLRRLREFQYEKHDDGFACDGNDGIESGESCHHHIHVDGLGDDHSISCPLWWNGCYLKNKRLILKKHCRPLFFNLLCRYYCV